jgi:hypothetical protein
MDSFPKTDCCGRESSYIWVHSTVKHDSLCDATQACRAYRVVFWNIFTFQNWVSPSNWKIFSVVTVASVISKGIVPVYGQVCLEDREQNTTYFYPTKFSHILNQTKLLKLYLCLFEAMVTVQFMNLYSLLV